MKLGPAAAPIASWLAALTAPGDAAALAAWGVNTARELTRLTDDLAGSLLAKLPFDRVAVYAVGGYGRRELAPFSDIDLLLVTDGEIDLAAEVAAWWDTGLTPSLLVRPAGSIKESAADDLAFATTLLDARPLLGRRDDEVERVREWLLAVRPFFISEHLSARHARHRRYRGAGFQEPNLREGRGGLRDLQLKRWLRAILPDAAGGAFDDVDEKHLGILLAARTLLHRFLGRRDDRLQLTDRAAINEGLGWSDPDLFSRTVLASLKDVARRGLPTPLTHPPKDATPRDAQARQRNLRNVFDHADERPVADFLRRLDERGLMESVLPEWAIISSLARDDAEHLYTPEEHTLRAVAELERLLDAPSTVTELVPVPRRDLMLLAAFLHDIGKGSGRDHVREGGRIAREVLARWGYPAADIEPVVFLVEHHLLLSHNAFRRDVDDPGLIHDLARKLGDVERLTMLYLLTLADVRSVSSGALNEWRASLLDTLTRRVARQCQLALPPAEYARYVLERRRAAVRELLPDEDLAAAIADHFARIDARYALAYLPERIADHIRLIPRLAAQPVLILKHHNRAQGRSELTVITRSHPGLFGEIAGTLAARSFNILEADIFTRTDDIAIDTFKVDDGRHQAILDEERWQAFTEELTLVLTGRKAADQLLAAQRPYRDREANAAAPPTVQLDNDSSPTHSIIEVVANDEIGLLHRLGAVFRDCHIEITSAIVSTAGARAVDVFYVTAAAGGKIRDASIITQICRALSS